jgi:hypothetical protein
MQIQAALESARALQSIILRRKSIRHCRVAAIAVFLRIVIQLSLSSGSQAMVVIVDDFDEADGISVGGGAGEYRRQHCAGEFARYCGVAG